MNDAIFQECLSVSVYLWIDQLAGTTFDQRAARAHRCAQIVGAHGDAIIYLVPTKGPVKVDEHGVRRNVSTAYAFNALAEGVACAAFQPGGIKCFGLHFEAHETPRPGPSGVALADHRRRQAAEEFWGGHTCPGPCCLCVSLALIDGSEGGS